MRPVTESLRKERALATAALIALVTSPAWAAPTYMITFNNGGAFMPEVNSSTGFRRDTSFALAPSNGTGQLTGGAYAGPGYVAVRAQLDCTWSGFSGTFSGKTRASATATDFIITGPAGPTTVPGTLRLRVRMNLDRSGGFAGNGAHNAAFQLNASTPYSGALGTITYSNFNLSSSGCFAGSASPLVDVEIPLTGNYPVNVPFSFQIYTEAVPSAYGNGSTNPGMALTDAGGSAIDANGYGVRLESGPVMTLPAGYTLNSPSWGVVGNAYTTVVGVGDESPRHELALEWAGPNPSAGPSRLTLALPRDAHARVVVFDLAGRALCTLLEGWQSAGVLSLSWDGRDADGVRAARGLYFVRAEVGELSVTRTVVRVN